MCRCVTSSLSLLSPLSTSSFLSHHVKRRDPSHSSVTPRPPTQFGDGEQVSSFCRSYFCVQRVDPMWRLAVPVLLLVPLCSPLCLCVEIAYICGCFSACLSVRLFTVCTLISPLMITKMTLDLSLLPFLFPSSACTPLSLTPETTHRCVGRLVLTLGASGNL